MLEEGRGAWPSPVIMPLSAWIESLWRESWSDTPILSRVRSQVLWERVVLKDKLLQSRGDILLTRDAAKTAYEAYSLMKEFGLLFPEDIYLTEEAKALKRWINSYTEEIRRLGFRDQLSLPDRVIQFIEKGRLALPGDVILAGFDELTPMTYSLIRVIEGRGSKVAFWPYEQGEASVHVGMPDLNDKLTIRPFSDVTEEVIQAARWINRNRSARPDMRIGIIVPALNSYKDQITREFLAELNPVSVLPWEEKTVPFNISLGASLYDEPFIRSAIDILSVDGDRQDIHKMSSIFLSQFIHVNEAEYLSMARLDAEFKKRNFLHISIFDIKNRLRKAREKGSLNAPIFEERLEVWSNLIKEGRETRLPSLWTEFFNYILKGLGWISSNIKLNSREYQSLNAWNDLLANLASLDDILGKIARKEALALLTKIAKDTIHQPESPEAPIQVLGILEASGIYFDHIWLLGSHEEAFPAQPSPNPFIPIYLQKEHNLPHSSPEHELAFSRIVLNRLLRSSECFEVSFPKMIDNRETHLSPLINALGGKEDPSIIEEGRRLKDSLNSFQILEDMPTEPIIPILDDEMQTISGGASIIKNQSACPFRAFATHRLNAVGITTPKPGFSPQERGTFVHNALKAFWQRVKDSEVLESVCKNHELKSYVEASVDETLKGKTLMQPYAGRYIYLEKKRIESLLIDWLEIEAKRSRFAVKELENRSDIQVAGLKVTAYIDRVDQLEGGGEVILDYKTGPCGKGDWLTERPRDPQLPFYSLSKDYDAIAFAKVRSDGCKFEGIAKGDNILPKIKAFDKDRWKEKTDGIETWNDLMQKWRYTIEALAKGFVNGESEVDPMIYSKTNSACKYCELMTLCRIFEAETL